MPPARWLSSASYAVPAVAMADINGSGSTLVAPLEAEWASAWSGGSGVKVNYNAVGSGQGIKDIISGLTDFGASDAPLTSDQASQCGNCVQIPWALGSVAVGYNLTGVSGLKLTGPTIAKIYLGQIKTWNDPAIRASNPGSRCRAQRSRRCSAATARATPTRSRTSCHA